MAVRDVASRAEGYGMPGVVVDGSDVLACYAAMRTARDRAIAGDGPTLIECKTYRFLPHTSDDDDKSYRSRQEVDEHRHSDPWTAPRRICWSTRSPTRRRSTRCERR